MAILVAIHHKTVYHYDRLINLGPQIIRLRPAPHSRTPIRSYSLKLEPAQHFINWQQDPQSNYLARVVVPEKTKIFSVTVDLVADMTVINPFDFFLEPEAEHYPFQYAPWLKKELAPFLETLPLSKQLSDWLAGVTKEKTQTTNFLVALNAQLQRDIRYTIRLEPGVQTPEQTLQLRSGSCRDTAWLLCQILRQLGIASRFCSGYLIQLKPDEKSLDGPSGTAVDFTDLHAWTEAYLPGAGWVGLDPTSGLLTGEGHIPVAATPDPLSAAPITGSVDPCQVEFTHEMTVTRVHEDPRVTKPYSDEQWKQIESLGHDIDQRLREQDVRLTMGGEPTFVSIDDMEGAEWNTAAVGPHKRERSEVLIKRLQKSFAPGALLFYGQGKWYPGESLPRWALACYWRKDGAPIWHDHSLIADWKTDTHFGVEQAEQFAIALAAQLAVSDEYVMPAFEDAGFYLHKEGRLPLNVAPDDSKLDDKEERERMRDIFTRGLSTPRGFVLPLQRGFTKDGPTWQSGLWMLRGQYLTLIPGDSPIGLRLPLPSLPWVKPSDYPWVVPLDPMAPRGDLPRPQIPLLRSRFTPDAKSNRQTVNVQSLGPATGAGGAHDPTREDRIIIQRESKNPNPPPTDRKPGPGESAHWIVRTALTIETRDGRLHIFMPPLKEIEDYLDLVHHVECVAQQLQMPVILEGTPPPFDPRINVMKVTPDPGVIEVNTHPAESWDELVKITTTLYEDARQARLGTEKFMLDGRHTGTGGGNHIVVGAAKPSDSPFLRRPDLLRSLIGYWLNHPSLSYLFSGTFIGPTSQSPRVDEARNDSVYELSIAFEELDRQVQQTGSVSPWLVDRLFRNLLTDSTGNTHRAEFCIDKLFAPESSSGRLGLVEFRGFEMPPHARMSLTQQLLLRSLIAWFWRTPYTQPLTRWGTQLHDQWLLPYYVERDFDDICGDLNRAGIPIERNWFAPHVEFRFPMCGRVQVGDIKIELQNAIEPWLTLGEIPGIGGTVREVDSSLERLQVKVSGLSGDRFLITCNGRRLPLQSTPVHGLHVAGVRYRAWQPPHCLHPTIGVDTPLVFDVLDTWSGRSLGGCQYHVSHPGGRGYDVFPVNALEAEARRVSRFFPWGHTPGEMRTPPLHINPEYPHTLDMRWKRP
jgi:uncharacterized protein (DUF2126 family)/transglutaminase-like putative cysteine protease